MSLQKSACAAWLFCFSVSAVSASESPNVLLIIADDMGLDASPCHAVGENSVTMPNLSAMCSQGLVFDNAYSAPVCSPTRATILTGKYGFRTGVGAAIPKSGGVGLSSDEVSLFDRLKASDYTSAVIGKWHVAGSADSIDHPATLGVDEYFGLFKGGIPDYYHWQAVHNGKTVDVDGYSTTVLTDKAIDWVDEQATPWFLWLAYNAPHTPFHLPPSDLHTNSSLSDDESAIKKNPQPYYNAALEALDSEMGRLLSSMDDITRNNTVVFFLGDNGTPGRVASKLYAQRGAKGSVFNGGTNVPLVVSGPTIIPGRSEALVNTTDIHATIASLMGIDSNSQDANDFSPAFTGQTTEREHVYVEHFSELPVRGRSPLGWAIRDAHYKLVTLNNAQPMLFDLRIDPFEENDLLEQNPTGELLVKAGELKSVYDALTQ